MNEEKTNLCYYCGKIVYHDLKLCCFHGAKELSDYFIKQYVECGYQARTMKPFKDLT